MSSSPTSERSSSATSSGSKRSHEDSPAPQGNFYSSLGDVSAGTFMSQKLSVKRRKMSQNPNTSHGSTSSEEYGSEENESQSSSSSEEESDEDDDDDDNSPAKSGVIEKITLKNFMCHDSLQVDLGPQINFIIGRNGSGKSAILTGISVGLGAKATDTNRGNSIRDLIKDGRSTARVSITFLNEGIGAYRPDLYGKRIIVERRLQRAGSNSYSIKSALGKTISTKKSTLDEILYKFSITIDNPLAFLSQDKAREFLTSTTDKTKYDYFMAGAFINDILSNYDGTVQNIVQVDSKVQQAKDYYQQCSKEYKDIAIIYNRHRQSDSLRHRLTRLHGKIHWFNVHQVESKVQNYQTRMTKSSEEIEELKLEIQRCADDMKSLITKKVEFVDENNRLVERYSTRRNEYEEAKSVKTNFYEKLVQADNEIKKHRKEIESIQKKIKENESAIKMEKRRLDEINGGSKETLRIKLQELQEERAQLIEEKEEIRMAVRDLRESEDPELREIISSIKSSTENINGLKDRMREMKSSNHDKYAAFGRNMKQVVNAINQNKNWHTKPIGPIGSHIELRSEYNEWRALMNTVLNKTLDSFIVTNDHDRQELLRILKNHRLSNPIIVRRFEQFDYISGKARHTTFLDMVKINNDNVLYTVIDNSFLEKSIITKERNQTTSLVHEQNVMNVYTLFSKSSGNRTSLSGNTTRQDPVYYKQYLSKLASGSLNSENEIREIEDEIEEEIQSINENKRKRRAIEVKRENKAQDLRADFKSKEKLIDRLQQEIGNLENKLNEDGDVSRLESLIVQIDDYKIQISRNEGVISSFNEEIGSQKAEYDSIVEDLKQIKNDVIVLKDQKEAGEEKLRDFETEATVIQNTIQQCDIEKNTREIEVKRCESKIEEGSIKLRELIQIAEEKCDREDVVITAEDTQESIAYEYSDVQNQIKEAEKEIGKSLEEVQQDLLIAKEKRNKANKMLEELDQTCRKLDKDLNIRFNFLHTTILSSVQQASRTFENALGLRGFKGTLDFAFDKKTLTLLAQTKNDKEKRTVDSLSGGEKSFAQIALLLSIWKIMDSKIRGLDEFDVYMDSVNRSISIKLLLRELRKYPKSQNIFITPQDIAVVGDIDSKDVKIIKMSAPRSD